MSIPSASWLVTIGAIVERACETSLQPRPAIDPESSTSRTVSKVDRKVYGSSPPSAVTMGAGPDGKAAGSSEDCVGGGMNVGPEEAVGEAVYAGGGSLEGTVKAFMPGLSGRLVGPEGPEGLLSGLGLLRGAMLLEEKGFRPLEGAGSGV